MANNLVHILRLERVQNIEKIFSIWHAAFGQLVREVLLDFLVFLRHRPDVYHRKFVEQRHVDPLNFFKRKKILVFLEDFPEEIFVDHVLRRHVQLH